MTSAEPKSGKLFKLGHGLFGAKWTEKWVHLDGHVLKYFSMASEQQPLFSLTSARQSYAIELASYDFVLSDDKRITRKHAFQLVPKSKTAKMYVFACTNERELAEWQEAFQPRVDPSSDSSVPAVVAEKMRRASEAFTACDPRRTDKMDASKLRVLLQSIGWQGDITEYSLLQQQLDPNVEGTISRTQYLRVMKHYWISRDRASSQSERSSAQKEPVTTPRGSFSDRPPRYPKRSEPTEPEIVSDIELTNDEGEKAPPSAPCDQVTAFPQRTHREEAVDESTRDWQRCFERLLFQPDSDGVLQRGLEMVSFITEFRLEAEQMVQEIVDEMTLDDESRKIPPAALDDDQFLATDYSTELEPVRLHVTKFTARGLIAYVTHDHIAHKIFGNQLRAAKALHSATMGKPVASECLQVPLQCVVDHLGFRALVVAEPSPGSFRIESSRTLTAYDAVSQERCQEAIKLVYARLGIFVDDVSHDTKRRPDQLPHFVGGCTGVSMKPSMETHRLVIQNIFDTFPSDLYHFGSRSVGGCQEMRPEFVSQYGTDIPMWPARPARLTPVQAELLEGVAWSAHEHLRTVLVPRFVAFVDANVSQIYDSVTLTAALHREGINARYLGLCYEASTSKHTKQLLLSEVIGRTCKNELRASLQTVFRDTVNDVRRVVRDASMSAVGEEDNHVNNDQTEEFLRVDSVQLQAVSRQVVEETTQCVLLEFFNLVFGRGSPDSHRFWQEHLLPRILEQFVFEDHSHIRGQFDTLLSEDSGHWPQVLQAVQFHTSVRMEQPSTTNFASPVPFGKSTQIWILPRSKLICRTTAEYEEHLTNQDGTECLHIIKAHLAMVDAAPLDEKTPAIGHLLLAAAELSLDENHLKEANEYVTLALDATRTQALLHTRALLVQIKVNHHQGMSLEGLVTQFAEAEELINRSLGAVHPFLFDFYMTMMEITASIGDRVAAKEYFSNAASLIKDCYGRYSLAYADIRRRQGEALAESGFHDEAMSILNEALAVYERLKQELDPQHRRGLHEIEALRASCIYLTAELQAKQSSPNALEIAFSSAVRAFTIREETLPRDHPDVLSSLLQLGELCVSLGDAYRAQEYYRPALIKLRELEPSDELVISQLNRVTHAVLHLHLQSLSAEKQSLVDRVRKRFGDVTSSFAQATSHLQDENNDSPTSTQDGDAELRLLRSVMRQLLEQDPVEYVNSLIDKTDIELQAHHRQRFASGTLRRDSAAEEPHSSPLRLPLSPIGTSRFESFAFGQPPQHSSRPSSPLPLGNGHSSPSTSRTKEWSPILVTSAGDFTAGVQLAALLFLVSLNSQQ